MDDDVRACMIVGLEQMRRLLQPSIESGPTSQPQPQRSGGETGAEYIHRILNERPDLCEEQLRLHMDMFLKLVDLMVARKLLSDGRFIKVAEQVGICLYILAKGASYRDAVDRFQHSIRDISMYFRKDCIGALDGTHIKAVIFDKDGVPFRGRKGTKTWNVLACCSFDRIFTFTNVGWEGSAHDMTVWTGSLTKSKYGFPHPPSGKYYLVDSGYPNTVSYLSPIKDKNLKKRWKVVYVMPQMEDKYQIYVIGSTFTLHNFMRMCKLGIRVLEHDVVEGGVDNDLLNPSRKEAMNKLRKEITLRIRRSIPGNVETREEEGNIELGDHLEQEQTSNIETDIEE
ncbi:hypothetical protein OROHE_006331 [Orobanche hederae]